MPPIAVLTGPLDENPTPGEVSWEDLASGLAKCDYTPCAPCPGKDCPSKKGPCWIPVRYKGDPSRLDVAVAAVTFAVFDLDEPTDDQLASMAQALDGTAYVMHQTHRGNGYRLVMPVTEEIPADDFGAVWPAVVAKFKIPADITCKNLGRIYFQPTRPNGSEYKTFQGEGAPLDWRALDLVFPAGAASAAQAFKSSLQADITAKIDPGDPKNTRAPDEKMDLDEMRVAARVMKNDQSRAMLNTILGGRKITENFPAEVGYRDTAMQQACAVLATTPRGMPYPWSTIKELLIPCILAMDCTPDGEAHWIDVAHEKYQRAVGRRLERDARSEADKAAVYKVLGETAPGASAGPGAAENWRKELIPVLDKEGNPSGLKQCGANINTVLRYDASWLDRLKFNEITKEIDVFGGPLEHTHAATRDTETANWLARSEYRLSMPTHAVGEQLLAVARLHPYDPLREELMSYKWDGKDRITHFFEDYFGATGDVEHIQRISECFLVSCIARAFSPGCEVHTVPILVSEGKQGVGKSRSLKALGGRYFSDTKIVIGDKDSRMLAASTWIVELAELAALRSADVELIKGFISQADDKIRPPYGRVHETFLRRCVFVGTSNDSEILSDWTGERRYWPINVQYGAVDRIKEDRGQILAQAVQLYRNGVKWYLTGSEAARAARVAEEFKRPTGLAGHVLHWFLQRPQRERPKELTNAQLIALCFGGHDISDKLQQAVGRAMKELGFTKIRKRVAEQTVWMYKTPEGILLSERDEKPKTDLQLVVDNAVKKVDEQ